MGGYLLNHDGTWDYWDISDPKDIEAFEVFGKENPIRQHREKAQRFQTISGQDARGWGGPEIGFPKMETNFAKSRDRKQNSEARKARLAKVEAVNSNGDSDQRRQGWGQEGNKPSCFE